MSLGMQHKMVYSYKDSRSGRCASYEVDTKLSRSSVIVNTAVNEHVSPLKAMRSTPYSLRDGSVLSIFLACR